MCDYSLCGLPNRLAVEGEELVVHKFLSGSIGLVAPGELALANRPSAKPKHQGFWARLKSTLDDSSGSVNHTVVCVPPGARLVLKNIPEDLQRHYGYPQIRREDKAMILGKNMACLMNTDIEAKKRELSLV